ncbi:unnamed protein product, partial [Vitis vinifera]|uniref:Uncharacterized protein n=1 Tax=Vitis vinifera TaxID=29760 RepID=D7SKA1_VITVI
MPLVVPPVTRAVIPLRDHLPSPLLQPVYAMPPRFFSTLPLFELKIKQKPHSK